MDKNITLKDFSGGLNTAVDESLLPANMSASLSNVDLMDSKAISRRKGYSCVTATPFSSQPVTDLYRTYRAAGSKDWVALAGTHAYYGSDASVEVNVTTEAESVTAASTVLWSGFSGGAATSVTATTTYAIPYCQNIILRGIGTSYKASVDGGAYTTASNGVVSFVGLSAATHALSVAPTVAVRNTTSLKLNLTNVTTGTAAVAVDSTHTKPDTESHLFEVSWRDPSNTTNDHYAFFLGNVTKGPDILDNDYRGYTPNIECYTTGIYVCGNKVADRYGDNAWHRLGIAWSQSGGEVDCQFFLDGVQVYERGFHVASAPDDFLDASIGLHYYARSRSKILTQLYVDDYSIDGATVNDFANTTGINHTELYGAADISASSTYCLSDPTHGTLDTIQYTAHASFTSFATVTGDYLSCATADDAIYYGTEKDDIKKWDGVNATSVADAPAAKFLVNFKRRLFAAGKDSDPSLLEYTAIGATLTEDFENWSGSQALRVTGKDAGGECSGLAVFNNVLFYFSPSRVHGIDTTGTDDKWVNKTLTDRYGCVAPRSIAVTPDALIFLASDGVRAYGIIPGVNTDDGSGFLYLSENVKPTLDRINRDYLDRVVGAVYDNRYYLSVPLDTATENSHTLVFKFGTSDTPGAWSIYNYGTSVLCALKGSQNALYGSVTDGNLHQLEYGTDDEGSEIVMRYRTPPLTLDGYATDKHYRRLYLSARADSDQTLTVKPYTDVSAPPPLSVNLTASSDVQPIRKPLNAHGRSIGFEFTSSGKNQDLSISEMTVTFVPPRMR